MLSKIYYLLSSILGVVIKLFCKIHVLTPVYGINRFEREKPVSISLTSYGRRVNKTVPYTIISLLRQTYKPDELVLWLDNKNWNEQNIPYSLKRLQKYGLSIRFCDDLRSYKKLIPTLINRPKNLIITADDDIYYPKDTIERLIEAYNDNANRVYCHVAHKVKIDMQKGLASYKEWNEDIYGQSGTLVFPVGWGCILYDPRLLFKDVTRKDLFTTLSPYADDVWFYFMEILCGTECCVIKRKRLMYFYPIDTFYQLFHKNASLVKSNVGEEMNDRQIKNVMDYYGITVDKKNKKLVVSCSKKDFE
jgi:hypothetical protein